MKKTPALAAFLGTLLLASPALAAQIYKWVDEKGVTHYAAEPPPPNATQATQVKVQTRLPSDSEAAVQNLEKQREQARKSQEQSANKPAAPSAPASGTDKKVPEQYAERCEQHRKNLKTMQEHAQIRMNDANGEPRTLTEEEKQAKLDETQRQIKAFCE